MKRLTRILIPAATIAAVLLGVAGCQSQQKTMTQERAAAKLRWEQSRATILLSLAQQQFDAGDINKAEQTCLQCMNQAADKAAFLELLGRIALERGHLEDAYRTLEQASALEPKRPLTHYLMGVILERWQRYDNALQQYELSYDNERDNAGRLLAVSDMLVKLDRSDEAIRRLTAKLDYFDHNAAIRLSLGRIYMLRHDVPKAIVAMREASILAPDNLEIREQLAMALMTGGHYADAAQRIQSLLSTDADGDRADLKLALSDCDVALRKPLDARAILLDVTRTHPADANAWVKLGQAAWIVGDARTVGEAAEHVVTIAPSRYEGWLLMGMYQQSQGHTAKALAEFDHASQVDPDAAAPLIMRGLALQGTGNARAAAAAYEGALKVAPHDARARKLLAEVTEH